MRSEEWSLACRPADHLFLVSGHCPSLCGWSDRLVGDPSWETTWLPITDLHPKPVLCEIGMLSTAGWCSGRVAMLSRFGHPACRMQPPSRPGSLSDKGTKAPCVCGF